MKHYHTTASTTYTTKGWKKTKNGNIYKPSKDSKASFQKELDQSLFSTEVKVEDLPKFTWFWGGLDCPNDLLKHNISNAIHTLIEVLEENQRLESQHKKATVNINWLEEAKDTIIKVMATAILYNRYDTSSADGFKGLDYGSKLVARTKNELIESLQRFGLKV